MQKKRLFLIMISFFLFVSGCTDLHQIQDSKGNEGVSISNIEEQKQIYFSMGKEIRKIAEMPRINETAILVNDNVISRKDIEIQHLESQYDKSKTFSVRVRDLVREEAVLAEANRLGITPAQETIDAYEEQTKQILAAENDVAEILQAYIDGMGITQEEYVDLVKKEKYREEQRIMLWDMVRPEEALHPAGDFSTGASSGENDKIYYEKYTDELMQKTKIQILDAEIQQLFPEGFCK